MDANKKIPNTSELVKKNCHAKITEIEGKMSSVTGLLLMH